MNRVGKKPHVFREETTRHPGPASIWTRPGRPKRRPETSRRSFKDVEKVKVARKDVIAQAGESRTALISASKDANMASAAA